MAPLTQPADLSALTWPEFEDFTGRTFALQGYEVDLTPDGPDGGVDVILHWGEQRFLVQCKHWSTWKVGVAVVRSLYGVMSAQGVAGGFVVASGRFSADAQRFAAEVGIHLVDGEALLRFASEHPELLELLAEKAVERVAAIETHGTPWCPTCGGPMAVRTAAKGRTAGNSFWGCRRYPGCKGKRDLDAANATAAAAVTGVLASPLAGPAAAAAGLPGSPTGASLTAAERRRHSRAERAALRRREKREQAIVSAISSLIAVVVLYFVVIYVVLPSVFARR